MNHKSIKRAILLAFVIVTAIAPMDAARGSKRLYMWLDAEANYARLSSPDSISHYISRLKETGFTDVVVDVKAITGEVLYKSRIAPYMGSWRGTERPADYDLLGLVEKACRQNGMGCYASLNVFAGGHNFLRRGIIYGDRAGWQSTAWWHNELLPISRMHWNYNGMLNPADPEVREYELSILEEFAAMYPQIDGIVLDRVRYDDISADFSQLSKEDFERYSGLEVEHFPEDMLTWHRSAEGEWSWSRGKLFKKWIEYRAMVIKTFMEEARARVKKANPRLLFGDYTGAWYPTYYYVGVNWASSEYDPAVEFDWATDNYRFSGYAGLLDLYMTGLYFTPVTKREVDTDFPDIGRRMEAGMDPEAKNHWYCIEGGAESARRIVCGAVPVTGSIYVEQYDGDAARFSRAVAQAITSCDGGVMIFDMCHICSRDWWKILGKTIDETLKKYSE